MALTKLRDFNPGTDGTFIAPVTTLESLGATRALLTTDDGVCQGYAHTDGRLWPGPLVTPNAGKIAADSAAQTAGDTANTKTAAAKTILAAQVARIRAIAAGSRSDQDKAIYALAWLLYGQE